jgi:7-cyano-7-deazaguanine synthase in queuosine biosynthesis
MAVIKPTHFISLSGGIDSTHCMYKLLKEGVHVLSHHIHLKNREGRVTYESRAVKAILEWFLEKRLYNFIHTETTFDYGKNLYIIRDTRIIACSNGVILADPKYKAVKTIIICASKTDAGTRLEEILNPGTRKIITEIVSGREFDWVFPNKDLTKHEVMAELPPDLLELCWYCRKPRNGQVCNKCHTCKIVNAYKPNNS